MKKVFLFIAVIFVFAACGPKASQQQETVPAPVDTVAVAVDSILVEVVETVDSTIVAQ